MRELSGESVGSWLDCGGRVAWRAGSIRRLPPGVERSFDCAKRFLLVFALSRL